MRGLLRIALRGRRGDCRERQAEGRRPRRRPAVQHQGKYLCGPGEVTLPNNTASATLTPRWAPWAYELDLTSFGTPLVGAQDVPLVYGTVIGSGGPAGAGALPGGTLPTLGTADGYTHTDALWCANLGNRTSNCYQPGDVFAPGSPPVKGSTVTLHAVWQATVPLDPHGGQIVGAEPTTATVTYGAPVSLPVDGDRAGEVDRTGYDLVGWDTGTPVMTDPAHPAAGGRWYDDGDTWQEATVPAVLTAAWRAQTRQVTFADPAGHVPSATLDGWTRDVVYDSVVDALPAYPARRGYDLRWNTQPNGGGTGYRPVGMAHPAALADSFVLSEATSGLVFGADGDVTLYAHWVPRTVTVTYDLNAGSVTPSYGDPACDGSACTTPPTVTYGQYLDGPAVLPFAARAGYDFLGWAESPEGAVKYDPHSGDAAKRTFTTLPDPDPTLGTGETGAVTLYAVWTLHEYTVTFAATGGSQALYPPQAQPVLTGDGVPAGVTSVKVGHGTTLAHAVANLEVSFTGAANWSYTEWRSSVAGTETRFSGVDDLLTTPVFASHVLYPKWTTTPRLVIEKQAFLARDVAAEAGAFTTVTDGIRAVESCLVASACPDAAGRLAAAGLEPIASGTTLRWHGPQDVVWRYVVTNTGEVPLTDVVLKDVFTSGSVTGTTGPMSRWDATAPGLVAAWDADAEQTPPGLTLAPHGEVVFWSVTAPAGMW